MGESNQVSLQRSLGPVLLCLYGLGNILGGCIYVLVGEVAGQAGGMAPLAFLVAGGVAALSALSDAEFSARYPVSAGEAVWVQEAFGNKGLSVMTGLLIAVAGLTSSAALARGFAGYLHVVFPVPQVAAVTAVIVVLGALAAWGVNESVRIAAALTIVEVVGLILVIAVAGGTLVQEGAALQTIPYAEVGLHGITAGAFLAFFAFIGFEEMVNVAEEVKDPQRTMRIAIVAALGISTVLYVLVAAVSVLAVGAAERSLDTALLALVYRSAGGPLPGILAWIGMAAVVNGVLVQIIMASRVTYGMSRQGWIPPFFGQINARTQTPIVATALVSAVVLALSLELSGLARMTSTLILSIFILVNVALLIMKRRWPEPPGIRPVPMWLPVLGAFSAAVLLALSLWGGGRKEQTLGTVGVAVQEQEG
jgi:APA family basic amino acid/polyamine antiporter